jgi:L-methionine (R)-S-oxide reductase
MSKTEKYQTLFKQIQSICDGEDNLIANLANITSLLHYEFSFWWTGFYFVKDDQLVLGPYQGPVACTRIPFGKGVCGTAWEKKETQVVADVHQFPGHIACSSESNSEIVVPIIKDKKVFAVLDIDSKDLNTFDKEDALALEEISLFIAKLF